MGRKIKKKLWLIMNDNKRDHSQMDTLPFFETITEWLDKGRVGHENSSALCFGQNCLNYSQLHEQSNKVAHYLNARGISNGKHVGICLERSVEMIVCVIGILKSGAAYVPLDPNYPSERLHIMKKDADLSLLVTHKIFSDQFDIAANHVAIWEKINDEVATYPVEEPSVSIEGEDTAYIIFTSGSTGRPKGVMMSHRALSNLIEWQLERKYFKKEANVLQYSSISFDVSFQEIATTLASGGTLHLVKDDDRRDPRLLLQEIKKYRINRLFIPFVALRSLIEVAITKNIIPASLNEVITAGEQLRVDSALRKFFSQLPEHAILDNQYGPTETHVISAHLLENDPTSWPDLPPIGRPLKNCSIYILDDQMQPVEEGESGELYLAGRNLARGYIGRNDLTEASFIKNPLHIRNRPLLYKSGDLGLHKKEGSIKFLGRSDHQIKIRGYRIEPGEINSVGAEFSGVEHCFTHAPDDTPGKPQLVTYFVSKKGCNVNKQQFKSHLSELLPDYMIPSFLVEINEIPYTPSGKVDLKSLPKPQCLIADFGKGEKVEYKSPTESKLALIWSDLLGFEYIPRTESFFDLGGDSLMAVTLFLRIENEFGKSLPLSTLAQASTVATLSDYIEEKTEKLDISKFRCLQPIQNGKKDRAPFFLVHGGGGNVLMFRELAKELDPDIPVFGFQWPGWDGGRGENDIIKMAKMYKEELRKAWPTGPYRLGGHCVGGIIALEIARLLRSEGAEIISPILVSDSPNLHAQSFRATGPGISDEEFEAFRKMKHKIKSQKYDVGEFGDSEHGNRYIPFQPTGIRKTIRLFPYYNAFKMPIKSFYNRFYNATGVGRRAFFRSKFWFMHHLSKPIPVQDRSKYSSVSQIHAIKKYEKKVYDEHILYLRSFLMRGSSLGLRGWWSDKYMGFDEVCSGYFDAHIIGGAHNDIFKDPYAQKLIRDKMFSNET